MLSLTGWLPEDPGRLVPKGKPKEKNQIKSEEDKRTRGHLLLAVQTKTFPSSRAPSPGHASVEETEEGFYGIPIAPILLLNPDWAVEILPILNAAEGSSLTVGTSSYVHIISPH